MLALATLPWNEDGESTGKDGGRPPQVARYLPYKLDGSGITVGSRTHLCAVDCSTGKIEQLTCGDYDVSSAHWSPDGTRIAFIRNRTARQRHRTDVWLADSDGGNASRLVSSLASVSVLEWAPDGRWFALAASEDEGDSRTGIWLVELDDGNDPSPRRLCDDDFEIDGASGLAWQQEGRSLATVRVHQGLQHIVTIDPGGGGFQTLTSGLRHVSGIAPWGSRLAFLASSMRQLNEVHSTAWDGQDARRHTRFNRAWFNKRARPRVAKRQFQTLDADGTRDLIDAWVLTPSGEPPYPVLVDMHGGPHSAVVVDYDAHTYWYELCEAGWAVVAPNAVGSAGYGHAFARRLRGRWGELDLPQVEAVVQQLQDEGLVDRRVVCTGKSYGGFLAAYAAAHSQLFRAAIVCAPVANIESHFGTSDTGYYVMPFAMDGEAPDQRERYHRLSPITDCSDVQAAVLILQGENDGRCPRGQAEELFANIIRSTDAPVEMVVYPTSTHAEAESGKPSNRVDYHTRIGTWAQRWASTPLS